MKNVLGSISPNFAKRSLRTVIGKTAIQLQQLTLKECYAQSTDFRLKYLRNQPNLRTNCKTFLYEKSSRKMLVKLTPSLFSSLSLAKTGYTFLEPVGSYNAYLHAWDAKRRYFLGVGIVYHHKPV